MRKAIEGSRAEYTEIRIEERVTTSIFYAGRELEEIGTKISLGGCVRAYYRGGWGFVSFNELDDLNRHVQLATEEARLAQRADSHLAPAPVVRDEAEAIFEISPKSVPLEQKEALVRGYNQIILSGKDIQTSQVQYRDTIIREYYLNSEGSYIEQEKVYTGIRYVAIARDGTNVQRAYDSVGQAKGYEVVTGLEEGVERVVKDAIDLLKAPKVEGGVYTVILDPKLCGVFVHEAFGHLSEADFLFENPRMLERMRLGARFGPEELSIVDDGTLVGENGYYKYDHEGVPARRTYLIRDGVLCGRLHSRETAGKMGELLTGNARALNYRYQPLVRMSCTYIEPRDWEFEQMLADIKEGIYAVGVLGGNTNLEMFTFTAEKAYLIKEGKLDRMVRDVVLSGNVFQTLRDIDAIGNDLKLFGGLGGCGKAGQSPLPVSDGGPHVRVRRVLIG